MHFYLDSKAAATMYSALFGVKTKASIEGRVLVYQGKNMLVRRHITIQDIIDAVDKERPITLPGIRYPRYPRIEPNAFRVRLFHPNLGAWIPAHRLHSLRAARMLAARLQNAAGCYWAVEILTPKNVVLMSRARGEKKWKGNRQELAMFGL